MLGGTGDGRGWWEGWGADWAWGGWNRKQNEPRRVVEWAAVAHAIS